MRLFSRQGLQKCLATIETLPGPLWEQEKKTQNTERGRELGKVPPVGILVVHLNHGIPDQLNEHLRPELLQGLVFHMDLSGFLHQLLDVALAEEEALRRDTSGKETLAGRAKYVYKKEITTQRERTGKAGGRTAGVAVSGESEGRKEGKQGGRRVGRKQGRNEGREKERKENREGRE
ncbi:hypothetical protein L345_01477, partial [Ophiophagus hannah]